MITHHPTTISVSFPDVHPDATLDISLERTLRVPDDGKTYPLPAALGTARLYDVARHRAPGAWKRRGGVFTPIYRAEAIWLYFAAGTEYPMAIKVAAGRVSAVTGEPWREGLGSNPQDYLVFPEQPWLDGFRQDADTVRQFVAAPLGEGHSLGEQVNKSADCGALQFEVYPMKRQAWWERIKWPEQLLEEIKAMHFEVRELFAYPYTQFAEMEALLRSQDARVAEIEAALAQGWRSDWWDGVGEKFQALTALRRGSEALRRRWDERLTSRRGKKLLEASVRTYTYLCRAVSEEQMAAWEMGFAMGGRIQQRIAQDPYGAEVWDTDQAECFYVHLVDIQGFERLTGERPPEPPATPQEYAEAGIPWFDYYLEGPTLTDPTPMTGLKSLSQSMGEQGESLPHNESVAVGPVVKLDAKSLKKHPEGAL